MFNMFAIDHRQGWPMPPLDDLNRPHYEAMSRGEVLVQHCSTCNTWLAPGAAVCDNCGAPEPAWRAAAGNGKIYSYVVYHRAFDPAFAPLVPYNVCLIELQEGPRLLANVVACANDALRCDLPVRALFEHCGQDPGVTLLKFTPT